MENRNIEEIRKGNEMDEYYEKIDAMTPEERKSEDRQMKKSAQ